MNSVQLFLISIEDERKNEQTYERTNGRTDGCMYAETDGCVHAWMDERIKEG